MMANKNFLVYGQFLLDHLEGTVFSQVSFPIQDLHSVSSVVVEELCANKTAITCLVAADVK